MITFGRLQGKSALKVLRISDAVSFSEMNDITDCLPDEMISDQLKLMDKEDRSIINGL